MALSVSHRMGTEGEKEISRIILDDEIELDVEKSKDELIKVAKTMISDYTEVGAIVLECTNMTPYAAAIQIETGLPVFDIYTLVNMVYQAVVRKDFCNSESTKMTSDRITG